MRGTLDERYAPHTRQVVAAPASGVQRLAAAVATGRRAAANSPVMIGMAILHSTVNTKKPTEKIAAPMRSSCAGR